MAGNYREGGIGPLVPNAMYIVADRNLYDEQYYYSSSDEAQMQTGGPLHTSAVTGPFSLTTGACAASRPATLYLIKPYTD